jgi:hypothetical protein
MVSVFAARFNKKMTEFCTHNAFMYSIYSYNKFTINNVGFSAQRSHIGLRNRQFSRKYQLNFSRCVFVYIIYKVKKGCFCRRREGVRGKQRYSSNSYSRY